jgi:hypothetical protein
MVYLAISCAVIAFYLFTILLFAFLKSASTHLDGIEATSFSMKKNRHFLWKISKIRDRLSRNASRKQKRNYRANFTEIKV